MKIFVKINDIIEKILRIFSVILMTILIVTVFTDVIVRNVIKKPIIWSTEVALISFIWAIFIGSAIAVRHRRHYIVEVVPMHWVKTNITLDIIADIASFALLYIMVISGIKFTQMGMIRYTVSLALPQSVMYVAIPISGFIMTLFNIEQLIYNVKKLHGVITGKIIDKGDDILESNRAING